WWRPRDTWPPTPPPPAPRVRPTRSLGGCTAASGCTRRPTSQGELEVQRALDRILCVGGDLDEAAAAIERDRTLHDRRDRVQPHATVAGAASLVDDRVGEKRPRAGAPRLRPDVQPLHLADALAQVAQPDAAHRPAAQPRQQQPAGRWRVAAR